ncbi:MAG: SMC-Scp complex subunit ScpB [Candidatus Omnitrophica bacterium]|nr:SMC-Scp complex subunit ScpB [Candidatus Omnitrophota bacterium]
MEREQAKRVIEALLFASESPVTAERLRETVGTVDGSSVEALVQELQADYAQAQRSLIIVGVAGGYQMATDPSYAPWIKKFYKQVRQEKLSRPALETLAIIAYKQPATKPEIEAIRGVDVSGLMDGLCEKGLIKVLGRKDAPGRPMLYGTTKEFLQYFGLNALTDLPKADELPQATAPAPTPVVPEAAAEHQTESTPQVT